MPVALRTLTLKATDVVITPSEVARRLSERVQDVCAYLLPGGKRKGSEWVCGDGPAGVGLSPAPPDLTDYRVLAGMTPLDFYRRVTIGVAGTAMPAFESRLRADERWAVAVYASSLRLPAAEGDAPPALREFATSARLSEAAEVPMLLVGDSLGMVIQGHEVPIPVTLDHIIYHASIG